MGYYINPPDKSKEQFLKDHGRAITEGAFTAAGIGYDKAKIEAFARPDGRLKL